MRLRLTSPVFHLGEGVAFSQRACGEEGTLKWRVWSSHPWFSLDNGKRMLRTRENRDMEPDLHFRDPELLVVLIRSRFDPGRGNLNVRHLAELAGLLSVHALQIVECRPQGIGKPFARLSTVSRQRAEAWTFRLETLSTKSKPWSGLYPLGHDPSGPVIEEILLSEILTRVLAGILNAQGQHHGDKAACLYASTLFLEHQEARRRALMHMVDLAEAENPAVRKLDKLRRSAERWTDILLGPLSCRYLLADLPFDMARSQDYGQAMLPYLTSPVGGGLYSAGLKSAFPESVVGVPSHAGLHRDMAAAVFGLLPGELFGHEGGFLPLRTFRSIQSAQKPDAPKVRSLRPKHIADQKDSPPIPGPKLSFSRLRRKHQKP